MINKKPSYIFSIEFSFWNPNPKWIWMLFSFLDNIILYSIYPNFIQFYVVYLILSVRNGITYQFHLNLYNTKGLGVLKRRLMRLKMKSKANKTYWRTLCPTFILIESWSWIHNWIKSNLFIRLQNNFVRFIEFKFIWTLNKNISF